jgi:hypothetical protein
VYQVMTVIHCMLRYGNQDQLWVIGEAVPHGQLLLVEDLSGGFRGKWQGAKWKHETS